jgi:hypothetical protein
MMSSVRNGTEIPFRKRRLGKRRGVARDSQSWSIFQLKPAFNGQQVGCFRVMADPIKATTTVTTGLIATTTPITSALISSFSTRFAMWDEYRVTRARIHFRPFAATNPGLIRAWIEPRSTATPTLAIAEASEGLAFSAADVTNTHLLDYKLMDPVFVDFTQTNATQNVGNINWFTNNANYGSSTVATDYFLVHIELVIQFRGLA